jgi:ATP-dependent phosphofructokinase / diphosphate-dependent phosphofructokinase
MYFKDIIDPKTMKTKVRMVDPASESFYIARRYMLRLNQADFDDPHELAKLAATAGMSIDKFKSTFGYLIESDLLYQYIKEGKFAIDSTESNLAHRLIAENEKPEDDEV